MHTPSSSNRNQKTSSHKKDSTPFSIEKINIKSPLRPKTVKRKESYSDSLSSNCSLDNYEIERCASKILKDFKAHRQELRHDLHKVDDSKNVVNDPIVLDKKLKNLLQQKIDPRMTLGDKVAVIDRLKEHILLRDKKIQEKLQREKKIITTPQSVSQEEFEDLEDSDSQDYISDSQFSSKNTTTKTGMQEEIKKATERLQKYQEEQRLLKMMDLMLKKQNEKIEAALETKPITEDDVKTQGQIQDFVKSVFTIFGVNPERTLQLGIGAYTLATVALATIDYTADWLKWVPLIAAAAFGLLGLIWDCNRPKPPKKSTVKEITAKVEMAKDRDQELIQKHKNLLVPKELRTPTPSIDKTTINMPA